MSRMRLHPVVRIVAAEPAASLDSEQPAVSVETAAFENSLHDPH